MLSWALRPKLATFTLLKQTKRLTSLINHKSSLTSLFSMPLLNQSAHTALTTVQNDLRVSAITAALGADSKLVLVGGTVRDALLGRIGQDIDLATALPVEEVIRRLEARSIRCIPTGLKHSTVSALVDEKLPIVEITSFRKSANRPSALSLDTDLRLRDFTINALAYDPKSGELFDPTGGMTDLAQRLVRAIPLAAERFIDDPLRLLRAVRFAVTLDFELEPGTAAAIEDHSALITKPSTERVRDEISRIILSPDPRRGFQLLLRLKLLEHILPELARTAGFEQNRFHRADLFEHTLHVVQACNKDLGLRLAALFHDIAKVDTLSIDQETGERHFFKHEYFGAQRTGDILERLKYPKTLIQEVQTLVRTHMRPLQAGAGGLRRLLRDTGESYPKWRELKQADAAACKIDPKRLATELAEFDQALAEIQKAPPLSPLSALAVNGHDLIAIGFTPGPELGNALRALHEQVLDNPEINTHEELVKRAEKLLRQ